MPGLYLIIRIAYSSNGDVHAAALEKTYHRLERHRRLASTLLDH